MKHPEKLVELKAYLRKNVIEAEHPKVHFDMQEWWYDAQEEISLSVPDDLAECGFDPDGKALP